MDETTERLEFLSPAWLAMAADVLAEVVREASDAIRGESLTVSEVFLDAPEHLRRGGSREIGWSFVIAVGASRVLDRAVDDADIALRAGYDAALPSARALLGATPEEMAARAEARRQAVAAGFLDQKGDPEALSPAMRRLLVEFHNRLAPRTR
jgi:hypothetical protein